MHLIVETWSKVNLCEWWAWMYMGKTNESLWTCSRVPQKKRNARTIEFYRSPLQRNFPVYLKGYLAYIHICHKKMLTKRLFVGIRCLLLLLHGGDLHMFRLTIIIIPTNLPHDLCMSRLMITLSRSFIMG